VLVGLFSLIFYYNALLELEGGLNYEVDLFAIDLTDGLSYSPSPKLTDLPFAL
jgi:hypothetical protein